MPLVVRHHPNTHGPLPQLPLPQECGAFCANVPGSRYLLHDHGSMSMFLGSVLSTEGKGGKKSRLKAVTFME